MTGTEEHPAPRQPGVDSNSSAHVASYDAVRLEPGHAALLEFGVLGPLRKDVDHSSVEEEQSETTSFSYRPRCS